MNDLDLALLDDAATFIRGMKLYEDFDEMDEDGPIEPEQNGDIYAAQERGEIGQDLYVGNIKEHRLIPLLLAAPDLYAEVWRLRDAVQRRDRNLEGHRQSAAKQSATIMQLREENAALRVQIDEANKFINDMSKRAIDEIPLTSEVQKGLKLMEGLTQFLEGVEAAGKPMTTQITMCNRENGEEIPFIHLWATTDDQDPVAKNRYLREENDNLKTELESLRPRVVNWVVVTEDPATMPQDLPHKPRIICFEILDGKVHSSLLTCSAECAAEWLSHGDVWSYVPEVHLD